MNKTTSSINLFLAAGLILAGCNNNEKNDEKESKSAENTHQKAETNKKANSEKQNSNGFADIAIQKQGDTGNEIQKPKEEIKENTSLTDDEIKKEVAMMLLSPQLKKQFINGQQLIKGQYPGIWGEEQGKPYKVTLEVNEYRLSDGKPLPLIYGAPKGMHYFESSPPSGPFATIIGVSKEYVYILGTQAGRINYDEAINRGTSQQFRVQDLKRNITNQNEINQVMNKITIGNNEFLKTKRIDENSR